MLAEAERQPVVGRMTLYDDPLLPLAQKASLQPRCSGLRWVSEGERIFEQPAGHGTPPSDAEHGRKPTRKH